VLYRCSVTGNKLWQQIESDCVVERTWQSIKDRFLKHIMPRITDVQFSELLARTAPIVVDRKRPSVEVPVGASPDVEADEEPSQKCARVDEPHAAAAADEDADESVSEVDPAETQFCQGVLATMSELYAVPSVVALHALLCCSGDIAMAGELLRIGHERMLARMTAAAEARDDKLRNDGYFSFADDVGLRDGDESVLSKRTRESIRARWLFLEMPIEDDDEELQQ
jgi:hypothetical protein